MKIIDKRQFILKSAFQSLETGTWFIQPSASDVLDSLGLKLYGREFFSQRKKEIRVADPKVFDFKPVEVTMTVRDGGWSGSFDVMEIGGVFVYGGFMLKTSESSYFDFNANVWVTGLDDYCKPEQCEAVNVMFTVHLED